MMTMKKIFFTLFALMVFALSAPSAAARSEAENKEMGKSLCFAGQYSEAIPYLEQAVRQNRRSGALWYLAICRQHLYDFDGAIEAVEAYAPVLNSDVWKQRADSLLTVCRIGQRAFNHTQDVVIIDSMLVNEVEFFSYYRLGAESGRIEQAGGSLYFENQAADYRIKSTGHGLAEQHKFQDQWDELHPLPGLSSEEYQLIDPFLRSDGATLYFASDSVPGMGGFDIYRTSYNASEGRYYDPERLGMPFNSPYNDYMMAFDETNQVGWWATDRNAPDGQVMIYIFIEDSEEQFLDEPTVSRARVDNIRETWRQPEGYADLLSQISEAPQTIEVVEQLHIVINDQKIYTSIDQFVNSSARKAYELSESLNERIDQEKAYLDTKRQEFAKAIPTRQQELRIEILEAEADLQTLYEQQREAVLLYRQLEQ